MKLSSWMALGALIGRELIPGKHTRNWKDAVLAAIIAKNEVLDKDGIVRKMAEQGASDGEITELQEALDHELGKRNGGIFTKKVNEIKSKRGFIGAFVRGFTS